jgi:hypothetical protein
MSLHFVDGGLPIWMFPSAMQSAKRFIELSSNFMAQGKRIIRYKEKKSEKK